MKLTVEQLRAVSHLTIHQAANKLKQHTSVVAYHAKKNGIDFKQQDPVARRSTRGKPWSKSELDLVLSMIKKGTTWADLEYVTQRTRGAINNKLFRLGWSVEGIK